MVLSSLGFPGCFKILPKAACDHRGVLVKTFVEEEYRASGLRTDFVEEFYSQSVKNVIRGLHFQIPPFEHHKTVSCVLGTITDVTVDLRVGSPTFGQCEAIELDSDHRCVLYLPPGIAHGFLTRSEVSVVVYRVTSVHSPSHDRGIRWDSIPFDWEVESPILSGRDASLPLLDEFSSPFRYSHG
jgi:dTDP-4-dehydrorhamnose 3,5-epimerase